MKKLKKRILAIPALGAAFLTEEMYRHLFYRKPSAFITMLSDPKGHEPEYYSFRDKKAQKFRETPHEEYSITSSTGQQLKGFYYPGGAQGKKIAFIIHGYRSEHAETAGMFYDYYHSRGIDLFCADNTAAGESQGNFIGFDILEAKDSLLWLDFLRETFGDDTQIILHGFSMGAATVMQMSSHCPENVKFIIEDSGFVNAKASLKHQIGPMYQPMRVLNRAIAGYDLNDSDVQESLNQSRIPMLFVHGRDDKLVPFENGPLLFEHYQGEKDCFFPYETRHIESMYTCPVAYGRKIDRFIQKYLHD